MTSPRAFGTTRLHVVTGKGGVGKTTVAAALALALTKSGKRVLLAEVEGRQGISQTFDVPPLAHEEVRLVHDRSGGELWGLSVDAKAALMEYLQLFYKLGRAGAVLEKIGAIDFATTIAPGVRDVLLIGKVYEAAGRREKGRRSSSPLVYDAVVLDAPPTGRIGRFLNVNHEVADIAKVGPIRGQADSISSVLHARTTKVHLVTLLEEMPIQETIDAIDELTELGFPLGALVVNQVRDPLLSGDEFAAINRPRAQLAGLVDQVKADLSGVGVTASKTTIGALIAEAMDHAQRVELQREQEQVLAGIGLPAFRLDALTSGVEGGGLRQLADDLREQGMV